MKVAVSPRALIVNAESSAITLGSVDTTVTVSGANGLRDTPEFTGSRYVVIRAGGSVVRWLVPGFACARRDATGVSATLDVTYPGADAVSVSNPVESNA